MKKELVFASSNPGKIAELTALLNNFNYAIIPQTQLNIPEVAETGLTFVENALLKARHACLHSGKPAIADDSGLVVPALNGAPGIFSARYAGMKASAEDNIKKLLMALQTVPKENHHAYFHCALVYLAHANDPMPFICEGNWSGQIQVNPRGTLGFGYDPVFYDPIAKCSAAELPLAQKNKVSHRGQALRMLMQKLAVLS